MSSASGFPEWHKPKTNTLGDMGLRVHNSLTDTKVPFVPINGKEVRMYVCGPTVYDSAHMGHARAYLTFDIIRRILEDYFQYRVFYQMNITDIDDKIILKARKGELVRQYSSSHHSLEKVKADCGVVVERNIQKAHQKLTEMKAENIDPSSREFEEHATLVAQQEMKVEQAEALKLKFDTLSASPSTDGQRFITLCRDLLADWLDEQFGATIEDKEIFYAHARKYEKEFLEDCESLGIREPTVMTRITEYVPEVVEFIQTMVQRGIAYESKGSVYFDTQRYKTHGFNYPKLVPSAGKGATDAEIAEGEGALSTNATGGDFGSEKRHRNDFALWKSSKRGEPSWESPWGLGRPGWHIECSVMASEVLGAHIDIHGGGSDLKFPHHDNEIAQSEAYHFSDSCGDCNTADAQWVNYFLHAGHLHIKGLKMSKSLKNFITIRQALQSYTARQLRIMFLLQQWDKPINFSDQTIAEAKDKETRFNSFFNRVKELLRTRPPYSIRQKWEEESLDFAINEQIATAMAAVHEALCDNFNTSEAMTQLDNIVTAVNSYMVKSENPKATLIQEAAQYVQKMLTIFGVTDNADVLGLSSGAQGEESKTLSNVLTAFASFREQLRSTAQADKNKMLLQMCDDLRDETMVDLGVRLEDKPDGSSVWSLEDPIALKREIEAKKAQKKREARMKERRKLETKVQEKTKELQRWTKALVDPAEFLRDESKYGSWDDAGLPLTFADGSEISKKARKQAIKEMDKHVKDHNEVETRGGESYVQSVEKELHGIQEQLQQVTASSSDED